MPEFMSVVRAIDDELDQRYNVAAGSMLTRIQNLSRSPIGPMQTSLNRLDEAMQIAEDTDEPVGYDHPNVQQTLAAYEQTMIDTSTLIDMNARDIEMSGASLAALAVTARIYYSLTGRTLNRGGVLSPLPVYQQELARAGHTWNTTNSVLRFVNNSAWIARMERWGQGYADIARATLLNGIQNGWGPLRIAEMLRQHAQNIPLSAAENLTRTLQLTAYRESSLAMEKINGTLILKKIRIASLDQRTCLACISLHGTELAPGQRVDDHYRGRCTEYYVVPGGPEHPEFMQADSPSGGRVLVPWQTGEEWFASLPVERQLRQSSFATSPGKWNAYSAGNPLSSFVTTHTDDVFGRQILENSIIGAFGETLAQTFYVR